MYIKQGLLLIFVIMYFFLLFTSKTAVFFFSDATLGHQMAPLQAKEKQRQLYSTRFVLKETILCSADSAALNAKVHAKLLAEPKLLIKPSSPKLRKWHVNGMTI